MADGIKKFSRFEEPGVLSALLALTSDAVYVFEQDGTVAFANEEGAWLADCQPDQLSGINIRDIFLTDDQQLAGTQELPFAVDGSTSTAVVRRVHGPRVAVTVRAERVAGASSRLVAVARPVNEASTYAREHDRLLSELSRANHRLAGTLRIVLDTLEAEDLESLFRLVLEELRDTMDAAGAVIYFGGSNGFSLGGVSESLKDAHLPSYLSYGSKVTSLVSRASGALRMRLLAPRKESLRAGELATREIMDEDARVTHELPAGSLPPFTSFYCVPIWYGERLIAFFQLGWNKVHPTTRDDCRLLDAVARYLSVQLMSALTGQRIARQARLERLANTLRDRLSLSKEMPAHDEYLKYLRLVADELSCEALAVVQTSVEGTARVSRDGEDLVFMLPRSSPAKVHVKRVGPDTSLGRQLAERGWSPRGALLDVGELFGERRAALFLCRNPYEPLESYELDFLHRLGENVRDAFLAAGERGEQLRISQALQMGMRNDLQEVNGLFAEGIYSSATASAYVGGDFYDLVRLPEDRACVLLGDVSGHGVEAASVAAAVRTAVEAYAWEGTAPSRMAALLNDFLLGLGKLETFATLFVGMIDVRSGRLTYCSAGHPPAMLLKADTGDIELLDVQSGAVGAFPEMAYRDGSVQMARGDALVLYTDGATEARSEAGVFFGDEGLLEAVARESERGIEGIPGRLLDAIDAFTGRRLNDDVAIVCLRYDGLTGA